MNQETITTIRTLATASVIMEYQLLKLKDGTKQNLKMRVNNAISSCRKVQEWFTSHGDASEETRKTFKQEFLGDEIVLLSELLETCYGINEEGLEMIISAIKHNSGQQVVVNS